MITKIPPEEKGNVQKMLAEGMFHREIGNHYGATQSTTSRFIRRMGLLQGDTVYKIPNAEKDNITKMVAEGKTQRQIAKAYDVRPATMSLSMKRMNIRMPTGIGELDRQNIEGMIEEGLTIIQMAKHYGISKGSMRRACNRLEIYYPPQGREDTPKKHTRRIPPLSWPITSTANEPDFWIPR